LGIDPERFTVLVSLGGEGIGKLHAYAEHYARHGAKAQLLVLAGRNTRLLEELKSFISRNPSAADKIKPYGFLPDIRTHLGAADMAAGKCGASFVSELVCARRPLAILQLGAPNEAANQDFLLERRYAWRTPDPRSFTELVDRLASDDGEYSAAVARMERASLCEGADQIADATSEYFASRLVRSSLYPADTASL
jgi:UDP-N-acetylglucosamine:LPS N-acetylglucosamine transferase